LVITGQGLDPKLLLKPATEVWPTYNGDYSGRRFSPLTEINSTNVGSLSLSWFYRISNVGAQRGVGNPTIKSTPLMVNGVLYFTIPDHAWAIDARTGEEIWHYSWQDKGGHLVGNRGFGMYGEWLYLMTPIAGSSRSIRRMEKSAGGRRSLTRGCSISALPARS
jgi:alcohol dehydrogenase (cytochrome c)